MTKINFQLSEELMSAFRAKCKENGTSMTDVLRKCAQFYTEDKFKIKTRDELEIVE